MNIVAIIGPDGSGKTTQAKMLVYRLNSEGYDAIYVRPNYFLLNFILQLKNINDIPFVSPRKNRVTIMQCSENVPLKILKVLIMLPGYLYAMLNYACMKFVSKKRIIICDRYFYQFFYDLFGNSSSYIIKLFPKPDITFFLNASIDIIYSRMKSSFDKTVCRDYYTAVINLFRQVSKKGCFFEIEAVQDKKIINDIIFQQVINYKTGLYKK